MKKHSFLLVLGVLVISLVMIGCKDPTGGGSPSGGGSTPAMTIAGKTGLTALVGSLKIAATKVEGGSGTSAAPWKISMQDDRGFDHLIQDIAAALNNLDETARKRILNDFFTITNGDDAVLSDIDGEGKGTITSNGKTYYLKIVATS